MIANLIAIVDDDESVRRTTRLLVESFGFQTAVFESAESYLSSGLLYETACLVVDIRMPGMDGLQLQSRIAAEGSRVPVVFITVCDDEESRGRAMLAGAVAFLAKPFTDVQLLEAIRSALHNESEFPKLISIVDDDESIRRTTKLLIESFGFRAAAFASAQEFLKSDDVKTTSCIIVDVHMPGMDGLQLQNQLAAMGRSLPVIFITAHNSNESRYQAMQAGAVAFLTKPFDDQQLLDIIRSATGIAGERSKNT